MKISLISVAIELSNLSYPLGALCIESAIKQEKKLENIECNTLLFELEDSPREVVQKLIDSNVEIVGLSIYLWNRLWFDEFIVELNDRAPNVKIFAGGTEVSANYKSFNLNKFIFMVAGEGENSTVKALLQYFNEEKVQGDGIMSKDSPSFSYSSVLDLKNIDSPILSGICDPFMNENSSILWEMTRGCPFHCGFCFESKGLRSVRNYPFTRIERELNYIVKKGVTDIFVLDPTFNIDKKRTIKILKLIKQKAPDIHFTFELRAELLDKELADAFASIYCSLQIGLQSIHTEVLNTVNRNFNMKLFKEKVTLLEERNLVYGIDLIIGLPNDNLERFKKSLDFTIGCRPSNIDIFPLSLLPGTKIADQAKDFGLSAEKASPYTILETPTLSVSDIAKAMKIKRGCDLFYTKGQGAMYTSLVCDTFNLKPSELFSYFNSYIEYLESKNYDVEEMDIIDLQDTFLHQLIKKLNKEEFSAPIFSYIEMHQGIAYYFETGVGPILNLFYEPNVLALLDHQNINKFIKKHTPFIQEKEYLIVEDGDSIDIVEYKA